jgi:hypothetical protein
MDATAVIDKAKGKRATKGRIEEGQEKVITLAPLVERVDELVSLYGEVVAIRDGFNDAVKAVAEASGLQASVVSKFVKARATAERFNAKKRDADQLSLCFDEVGLVRGA